MAGTLVTGQLVLGLTYIVGARSIDPATLGLIATVAAMGQIAATVFDAGFINYSVRETAAARQPVATARALVRAKRRWSVLVLLVGLGVALALAPSLPAALLLALTGPAMWEAQTAHGLLRAAGRFSKASLGQLAGRVSGLAVALALVPLGADEVGLAAAIPASFAAEALIDRCFLGAPPERATTARELVGHHRESFGFGLANLASQAQQLDTPLVTLGAGAFQGGLYAAAGRLLGPLLFLATSLTLVSAPWLAHAGADPAALRVEERRVVRVGAVLALAPLVAAVAGPPLIPLLLGAEYASSGAVFAVLAVGAAVTTLNQAPAIIAQNRGHQRGVATAIGTGLVLGLVATLVLSALGGAVWAAAGFLLSQAVILVLLCLVVRRARRAPVVPR
ncbi:lipopolysaccharide biosynthesis protein [Actinomycetospora sp. CA-101289]|uniref:lipopolysaccharide biosynthesis protein n=1 Tax=Actinomycetospora sp. CA-101289 TaxID=3239893 RepID=UPI003D98082F